MVHTWNDPATQSKHRKTNITTLTRHEAVLRECLRLCHIFFRRVGQTRNHKRNSKQTNGLVLFIFIHQLLPNQNAKPNTQAFSKPIPHARSTWLICIYIHFVMRYCVTCVANCFILLRHIYFRSQFSSSFISYATVVACVRMCACAGSERETFGSISVN